MPTAWSIDYTYYVPDMSDKAVLIVTEILTT
jgi:hypothetical protein